jgi:hypothetical protein
LTKTLFNQKQLNFFPGEIRVSETRKAWHKPRLFLIALLISTLSLTGLAVQAFQSVNIPFEVKEPLEILEYPSGFSVYRGETVTFDFTVQNLASVTYFEEFNFLLNDTDYQANYVTFSNHNYSIPPGVTNLSAWLTVAPSAPPANLILTIERKTNPPAPSPSPTPDTDKPLEPSLQLLRGGARWAAPNGTTALYINYKDTWSAHHLTDGVDWGPWFSMATMDNWRSSTTSVLEQAGFAITFAGDIPETLKDYDLVVIEAVWAVEPKHAALIEDYLSNGGGVVILRSVPCYLSVYCKTHWPGAPGTNLSSIEDWFGGGIFQNQFGQANLVVDIPFGTDLVRGDVVYTGCVGNEKSITSLSSSAHAVATWEGSNCAFAFTHEYGSGRLYYQGETIPEE